MRPISSIPLPSLRPLVTLAGPLSLTKIADQGKSNLIKIFSSGLIWREMRPISSIPLPSSRPLVGLPRPLSLTKTANQGKSNLIKIFSSGVHGEPLPPKSDAHWDHEPDAGRASFSLSPPPVLRSFSEGGSGERDRERGSFARRLIGRGSFNRRSVGRGSISRRKSMRTQLAPNSPPLAPLNLCQERTR